MLIKYEGKPKLSKKDSSDFVHLCDDLLKYYQSQSDKRLSELNENEIKNFHPFKKSGILIV